MHVKIGKKGAGDDPEENWPRMQTPIHDFLSFHSHITVRSLRILERLQATYLKGMH
jgi:hypothetical protein